MPACRVRTAPRMPVPGPDSALYFATPTANQPLPVMTFRCHRMFTAWPGARQHAASLPRRPTLAFVRCQLDPPPTPPYTRRMSESPSGIAAGIAAAAERAHVLAQALPFLRRYAGVTIVVKYGGHAMGE